MNHSPDINEPVPLLDRTPDEAPRLRQLSQKQIGWSIALAVTALIGYGIWSSLQFAFLHIRIQGVSSIKSIELYQDHLKGNPYYADHESHTSSTSGMWVVFPRIPYRSGNNVLRVTLEKGQGVEQRSCSIAFTYPRCFAEIYISGDAMRCNACTHD